MRVTQIGRTINLSEEGACLLTAGRFPPGHWMQLEFDLPQGPAKAWAQVVWDRENPDGKGWITGFRLTELGARDRKRLSKFIAQQLRMQAAHPRVRASAVANRGSAEDLGPRVWHPGD